jgi:peptide/nickel transport system substrate-binding protein
MRFVNVVTVCLAVCLVVGMVSVSPSVFAVQPPVDTSTLYVGTIGWGPRRADPVRAYDSGSMGLIFNVYDTLISFKGELYWEFEPCLAVNVPSKDEGTIVNVTKSVSSMDVDLQNPTGSTWSDGSICIGWVDNHANGKLDFADVVYMIEADGSYRTWQVQSISAGPPVSVTLVRQKWIFHIRTKDANGNPIYFVDEGGSIVDTFDIYDAEYSFKRGLVQDQIGSPMWMLYKPLFDQMNSDPFESNTTHPTAMDLAHLIDNAIEVSGNDLIINLGILFPEIAFKQILSQSWAAMVSKEFSISIGCWNGDLYTDSNGDRYPDWWTTVRRLKYSPYDAQTPIDRPPGVTFTNGYRYVGTGPYRVITFDAVGLKVELVKNDYYWGGWTGKHLNKIVIKYIADWSPRKAAFLAGEIDVCAVPRANMFELLDPATGEPTTPGIITIKKLWTLSMYSLHFTFTLDPESPYVPERTDTHEPLPNFFNNTHVRKAFCYAFDHAKYIKDAWFNEARWRNNMLIYGLVPDYYNGTIGGYDINRDKAIDELKAVVFPDGKTLYDAGFTLTLPYFTGSPYSEIYEMLAEFFRSLGPQFQIAICVIDWDTYLDLFETYQLPIQVIGWIADFPDADNFARPYMHSYGDFAYYQNYTAWNGWVTKGPKTGLTKDELIDLALKTQDPSREALFYDLQWIYYMDAPFLPLCQPANRRWQWYWVKGWYFNALYPGDYYYSMYKEDTCWYNISGPTPGVPDDITNMRDVVYLILHFNAKAPDPGKPPDPRWVGTYGVGGVDPYGDRVTNMRDITFAILHFMHRNQP